MNDADFEMLAKASLTQLIAGGIKPCTLPTHTWLRMRALELAMEFASSGKPNVKLTVVQDANNFYNFLKGEI